MRVLIFGDSIVQGFWDAEGGWVARLQREYRAAQLQDVERETPTIMNLGVAGDTSAQVLARFTSEARARRQPDLAIVLAVGINDTKIYSSSRFEAMPEVYAANIEALIKQAAAFASAARTMCIGLTPVDEARTTPPRWVDISFTNERIKQFDSALQATCIKHGIAYAPVFEKFQARPDWQDLLLDGLHPTTAGHQVMQEIITPPLTDLVRAA